MSAAESTGVAVTGEDAATPATTEASTALVAALGALDDLRRDKTAKVETKGGGSYSYAYTDLAGVLGAVRPVLAAHGFAVVQPCESGAGVVSVSTVLVHASGHRFDSPPLSMRQPETPQALGSLLTYLRRYSLLGALGLATEDDDGKAATVTPPRQTRPRAAPSADESTRRTRHAMTLFGKLGLGDRDDRLNVTSAILGREIGSWSECSPVEQNRIISELQVRLDEQDAADGLADAWDAEVDHAEP